MTSIENETMCCKACGRYVKPEEGRTHYGEFICDICLDWGYF